MRKFWNAVDTALVAIPELVTVTGHDADNMHISRVPKRHRHERKGLYFSEVLTSPWNGSDYTDLLETDMDFFAVGETELEASDIAKVIYDQYVNPDVKLAYLNISNADVHCHRSTWDNQTPVEKQEDSDLFITIISVTFRWSYK